MTRNSKSPWYVFEADEFVPTEELLTTVRKRVRWPALGKPQRSLDGHTSPAEIKSDLIFAIAQRVAGEDMTRTETRLKDNLVELYRNSPSAANQQTARELVNQVTGKIESIIIAITDPLPKRPLRNNAKKRAVTAHI